MTAFVILCAAMALVASFLVAWPLLRPFPVASQGETAPPRAAPVAFAVAVALVLGAAALYAGINNFPWHNPQLAAATPPGHGELGEAGSMDQVTATLEARLRRDPSDRAGWRMLGRTYLVTGNPAKAAGAYERAAALDTGKDAALELDLAEALVLTNDPAQQPRAKAIVAETLAADGNNQKALWYQGVIAAREGDTETAKTNWTKLLEQDPPPEIREVLANQLRELGVDVPAAPAGGAPVVAAMGGMGSVAAGPAAAQQGRAVRVNVKVDPALATRVRPGVPLFISAREPGIPGPPLAAVRLTTDALPTQVVLSDANAMLEGRNLSSVDDIEIVARVAFGGTAVTASGDLIGSAVQGKGAGGDLEVVISRVQP